MILNCTNHVSTSIQRKLGVIEPEDKKIIQSLITFNSVEELETMEDRANELLAIIKKSGCNTVMIAGAPFFMGYLEEYLLSNGINVAFAFNKRDVVEMFMEDGMVKKVSKFDSDTLVVRLVDRKIKIITI